ncbi:phage tail protein [Mycobacteroides abscessus]|uniref:phage tail protein n=1 Tax=Mycobacteroides abscessus TaxID=36809 RepID=UPI0002585133|nr:hypothetical protein [Mycobacteroides abscessus]EIC67165.1 minor tail protein Gp26 [Mycobacteroides abscessus M93]
MSGAGGVEVGRISVKAVPKTDDFRDKLMADLRRIEREVQVQIELGIDIDSQNLRQRVTAIRDEAQATLRDLQLGVDVDSARLRKSLAAMSTSASGASEGLMSIGRTGLMVSAILAAAAPAVGLISGLLAGLPSLAAGFAAGAGAIALGMEGIKTAAQTLKPEFDALKASVSATFQQQLAPAFDQLQAIFPTLQTGMSQVAVGLSDMFKGVTGALTSGEGLGQLQNILANVGSAMSAMKPVVESFTSTFLNLASAGSNSFGLLVGSLDRFASSFGEMINRVTSNGVFEGAMQGLSQTLDGVLNLFTRLMESGLGAMGQLGGPLNTFLGGFGDLLTALMPALTSFAGAVGDVLGTLGTSLAPVVTALTPAFQGLMGVLGPMLTGVLQQLSPVLTEVATALDGAILAAVQAIQPHPPMLVQAFGQIAGVLGEALVTAINQLVPILPQIVQNFTTMLPAVVQLVTAIAPLVPAFIQLAGAVLQVTTSMVGALTPAISGLVSILATVIGKVAEWVAAFVSGVASVVAKAAEIPGQVKTALGNLGTLLVSAGKDLIQGLINGMANMATAVIGKAKEIASSAVGAVKSALGIHSPSRVMAELGGYAGEGFANGLQGQKQNVVNAAKDVMQGVKDEVGKGIDWNSQIHKSLDVGTNFLEANGKQLMSDLGMGGGALTALGDQALQFGKQALSNFTFNVSNVDEAMAIKNNQLNKQALGMWRR